MNYPIVADPDRTVAETYGMIPPNSPLTMAGKLTVRTVWIIDPNNKVRLNLTYPAATGTLLFSHRCVCVCVCRVCAPREADQGACRP